MSPETRRKKTCKIQLSLRHIRNNCSCDQQLLSGQIYGMPTRPEDVLTDYDIFEDIRIIVRPWSSRHRRFRELISAHKVSNVTARSQHLAFCAPKSSEILIRGQWMEPVWGGECATQNLASHGELQKRASLLLSQTNTTAAAQHGTVSCKSSSLRDFLLVTPVAVSEVHESS